MFLACPVRTGDVVCARRDELFHERVKGGHLRRRVRQLVRYDGGYGRALDVSRDRLRQQAAVLRYLGQHQLPGTLYLVEVLHGALRVREVFEHLVLHAVYSVERQRHRRLRGDNLLLRLPALFMQVLQLRRLCHDGCGQCRIGLLCMARKPAESQTRQGRKYGYPIPVYSHQCFHIEVSLRLNLYS